MKKIIFVCMSLLFMFPVPGSTTNQRLLILEAKEERHGWTLIVRGLLGGKVRLDATNTIKVSETAKIFLDGLSATPEVAFNLRHQGEYLPR